MPNPNGSIGAIQIGGFIMVYLCGIVTVQTYYYYRKYPNDSLSLKALVATVWFMLLGHCISVAAGMYTVSVAEFGKLSAESLSPYPNGFASSFIFTGFLVTITQGYFIYHIRVVSKRLYIPVLYWTTCLVRVIGDMTIGIFLIKHRQSFHYIAENYSSPVQGIFVFGTLSDLLIAVTMCHYLKRRKSSALGRTVKLLDRLMKYTIETGVLTGLTGIILLVCNAAMKQNFIWFGMYLFLAEVYANALLANLNAREAHNNKVDNNVTVLRRLEFLPNNQRSNPNHLHDILQVQSRRPSKDITDLENDAASPYYTNGEMPLEPPGAQGIIIEVCQETQVDRDGSK
ncbi:hypothetical protein BJ138DRAFT_1129665 [Hygrophoropsis aurantiaca]|uniref:Uncharacterized protein n=1 Tax=Hygrophoropsis aurantiaca TaxID=72124 RepID=A0ACB8A0R7_9AGAM|nr:hypothetical protein BJ138DRAFT_1129665 [Hygrophoropsis aurantiaca]